MKRSAVLFVFMGFSALSARCQVKPSVEELRDLSWLTTEVKPKREYKFLQAAKVPTLLIGLGAYSALNGQALSRYKVREERNEHMPNFKCPLDNYLMHVPVLAVYGLNAAGIKGKHDFRNRTLLLAKSEMIMAALTFGFKSMTHVERPDNSNAFSFPSGHTAQAFATATFMAKEYKDESIWYAVGAYGMASTVGAMRIMNNRHWISDVFAGAGIGILSTNIAYLTHRYRWANKNSNLTVIPTYSNGPGVYIGYRIL